tara:strand:+ start:1883 stop:3178 length:1296 start_codon:yes stop_codon:yes gene_type:complete
LGSQGNIVRKKMSKKVLIRGPILTQSGYGEHARFIYRALSSRPDLFEVFVDPINWGKTSWMWEDTSERRQIDQVIGKTQAYMAQNGQFDMSFLVTIPGEWEKYRAAPINIGVTAGIESNKVSAQWLEAGNKFVNKIIVPSKFSKQTYADTVYNGKNNFGQQVRLSLNTPISVVNYPVKKYENVDLELKLEYDFNFLVVAQWGPRKNVENTIRWFVEEFYDKEVGLVLKLNHANNSLGDRTRVKHRLINLLKEYKDRKCKIHLVHGYMNNDEIHSLYNHPKIKALLSLTHGEGYGLPLFEAAYCGLPIITHDWGGQADFLMVDVKDKSKNIKKKPLFLKVKYDVNTIQKGAVWNTVLEPDSMWAYPKQGHSKMRMREMYKQYGRFKTQAKKLKKHVTKEFAQDKVYASLIDSLKEYLDIENEINKMYSEIAL